jgi:hypothetical protein
LFPAAWLQFLTLLTFRDFGPYIKSCISPLYTVIGDIVDVTVYGISGLNLDSQLLNFGLHSVYKLAFMQIITHQIVDLLLHHHRVDDLFLEYLFL